MYQKLPLKEMGLTEGIELATLDRNPPPLDLRQDMGLREPSISQKGPAVSREMERTGVQMETLTLS